MSSDPSGSRSTLEPLTLAIEVSNPSAQADSASWEPRDSGVQEVVGPSVALARGARVLDQEPMRTPDSRHDDDLMPAIDRLVRRAGFTPADLRRVAVSLGPGGFTGLRVAIATAKALGEAIASRGHPAACCVGVPSASVVAATVVRARQGRAAVGAPAFAVALASKRDTVWLAIFDAAGVPVPIRSEQPGSHEPGGAAGVLVTADELGRILRVQGCGALVADRFLPGGHGERAAELGIVLESPIFSAAACARVASGMAGIDPADLLPLYPREPEAVTKWRVLHPPSRRAPGAVE